jgi:hypothetical protein
MMLAGYDASATPIVISLAETGLLVLAGWWVFSRLEVTMADDI